MGFTHKVPRPFQQEDKWFKYFNPIQAVFVVVTIVIVFNGWKILAPIIGFVPTLCVAVLFVIVVGLLLFLKAPPARYLFGGRAYLSIILLRCLLRSLNRVVYTKQWKEE